MDLGDRHTHGIDLHTERMIPVLTLENTNIKLEPEFHTSGDDAKRSDNSEYVVEVTDTIDIKTEVIDNDHYGNIDAQNNHGICSNHNYIDDTHVALALVKSEPTAGPLERTEHTGFIIEIDTCKDEYCEPDRFRNSCDSVKLGESRVEQGSDRYCATKEHTIMPIMEHNDTQRRALHTSNTTPCTVVLHDIRYTYPYIVSRGSVHIHGIDPAIQIITQTTGYLNTVQQANKKPHICSCCGVGFTKKSSLKMHMRIHTGEKPHTCSECGIRFKQKSDLKIHARIHTGEKPYTCNICEDRFAQKGSLIRHTRTHTCERSHLCTVCGVGFTQKGDLNVHMGIHTGEKHHKCAVCGVSFVRKGHLTTHMRSHTREKLYMCTICGVAFACKGNLNTHMRIHTGEKPHACGVCGRSFTEKRTLVRHMRTHTGEKPYKCTVCAVVFANKCNLTSHQRIHTGDKPYTCSVCEVGFTQSGGLRYHMTTHTDRTSHI